MKGFKDSTRMKTGFGFSSKHGFTGSTGKVQQVRGYTRKTPGPLKKAVGGKVEGFPPEKGSKDMVFDGEATTIGDQGNTLELRSKPITEFDKDNGGKSPLKTSFAFGGPVGMAGPLRMAVAAQQQRPMMRTAIPRAPMNRRGPLMRAKGGFLKGLKKGALHKTMGIPQGKKIPAKALKAEANSDSALTRKRAQFAINAKKWG